MTANPVRPARYRPGKPTGPDENSDSESESESESASESASAPKRAPKPVSEATAKLSGNLKTVNLKARFSEAQRAEETRLAAEQEAAATAAKAAAAKEGDSEDEYTTDESEEESDEESEEEEEEAPRQTLLRPTFVPKSRREGNAAKLDAQAEQKKKEEEEARQRQEADELLEERLKRDAIAKLAGRKDWDDAAEDGEGIDDTDDLDPAAERAAWKLRELLRVKRERDALEQIEKEREEVERRREMDPELRAKEDMEFVAEQRKKKIEERGQMGFMQKFYHKGAFYQDESEVLKRNYATAPVEDSAKNREVLPKYMQVRGDEVGKRGRTKWSHLTAEDTSLQEGGSPWFENKKKPRFGGGGPSGDDRFRPDSRMGPPGDDRFKPDSRTERFGDNRLRPDGRMERPANDRFRPGNEDGPRQQVSDRHPDFESAEHGNRKRSFTPPLPQAPPEKRRRWDQEP